MLSVIIASFSPIVSLSMSKALLLTDPKRAWPESCNCPDEAHEPIARRRIGARNQYAVAV